MTAPCHGGESARTGPPTLGPVRIPDGDLVPRRRRSRYGGHYGRRRRRSRLVAALGVLVLGGVGLGYWYGVRDEGVVAASRPCPTPTPTPRPSATAAAGPVLP